MNKYLKLGLAIIISLAGLYIAFRNVQLNQLVESVKQVNGWYILLAMLLMVFTVVLRAWRWQFILSPIKMIGVHPLFASTMIGYFGNSVLPFRLGELLRAYSLSRSKNIATSTAFGTIILERVLDMLGLLGVTLLFFTVYPFPGWLKASGLIAAALTLFLIIFLVGLGIAENKIKDRIYGWKIFDSTYGERILALIDNLVSGLIALKSTHHFFAVTLLTVSMWVAYYIQTYLVVLSVDVEVTWIAVGVCLIATTLVITVPSAPGYIGTYHATAVLVMVELFNVPLVDAQAFAVLVHAIGFLPFAVIGFMYFLRSSVQIKDIQSKSIEITGNG